MTNSEAGQARRLESGIREPLGKGANQELPERTRKQQSSRRECIKARLVGPRDLGLNPGATTYCVILHKLLNLSEPHTLY